MLKMLIFGAVKNIDSLTFLNHSVLD